MRDKNLSLFRGKACSMPAFDWSPATSTQIRSSFDGNVQARLELAQLQDQIYLLLCSNEALRQPATQQINYIHLLNDKLQQWTKNNSSIFSEDVCSSTDLHIAFRSTRIITLRRSLDPKHKEQVLQDSRISCRLIVAANARNGSSPSVVHLHR